MSLMPFPEASERIHEALLNLALIARGGETAQQLLVGGPVPRPWDITTIDSIDLRWDTWRFLEGFVKWLNCQHAWASRDQIPGCWPLHPPLIREIGTLAFQRMEVGESTHPTSLEEWHRYALPSFLERTREQRQGCIDTHVQWPGRAEYKRHVAHDSEQVRLKRFREDCGQPLAEDEPTMVLRLVPE